MKDKIKKLKEYHKRSMDMYNKEKSEYIENYGNRLTDFLVHRLRMSAYHRGAWNVLNDLEKGS